MEAFAHYSVINHNFVIIGHYFNIIFSSLLIAMNKSCYIKTLSLCMRHSYGDNH